jgi:hypothetical protein
MAYKVLVCTTENYITIKSANILGAGVNFVTADLEGVVNKIDGDTLGILLSGKFSLEEVGSLVRDLKMSSPPDFAIYTINPLFSQLWKNYGISFPCDLIGKSEPNFDYSLFREEFLVPQVNKRIYT